jgi:glycosyltransferase involved in cell wall biosynthesis
VRELRARDDIDVVHDHVEAVGLATLAAMGDDAPPVLHTLHWDLAKHPELYGGFDGGDRVRVNGVSASQLARAPQALQDHAVGHVHLATPLAVDADRNAPVDKGDYVVMLGRITAGKGQDVGARLAHEAGFDLVLAGPVGPYQQPDDLAKALADPATAVNPDVRFWAEQVAPHVDGDRVRWIGTVGGSARDDLVAGARAMLAPLRWEEPGGTFVVESLALGTPVVATARGCLPELIEHERTGLLADDEADLADLVIGAGKLDPAECRREAARRFTPAVMARRYVELYEEVVRAA